MEINDKEIEALEANTLALRKIADTVIEQIRAAKRLSPARNRKNKSDGVADLTARIAIGQGKPSRIRKKKKRYKSGDSSIT